MNLLDEAPDVNSFFEFTQQNIQSYKLYPGEEFSGFLTAALASTFVDLQGEAFTREALESGARQMNKETLWMGAHHDPLIQPYGRIISAKVFYAPKSDLYFTAALIGLFDPKSLPTFQDVGIDCSTLLSDPVETTAAVDESGEPIQISFSPHEIDREIIEDILADSPPIVSKRPMRSLRKSADPITIISVIATMGLLMYNPFSKKLLERYGERAADGSIAFLKWLSTTVFQKLQPLRGKRVVFEFVSNYKGCRVQFVIDSLDTQILCDASNSVFTAARSATKLIDRATHLEMTRLIYEYDKNTRQWLPLHATSKLAGVISDRPYLIAIDQIRGISVGGFTPEDSIRKFQP